MKPLILSFRCNFDQSQRVTWIDLAVSLSLHKDACIAVWLDVDIGKSACPPPPVLIVQYVHRNVVSRKYSYLEHVEPNPYPECASPCPTPHRYLPTADFRRSETCDLFLLSIPNRLAATCTAELVRQTAWTPFLLGRVIVNCLQATSAITVLSLTHIGVARNATQVPPVCRTTTMNYWH